MKSELKVRFIDDTYIEYYNTGRHDLAQIYLKSEADKVIARQKKKRCLAMAKWCFTKSNYHFVLARHGEDAKKNNRRSVLYSKWRQRWLAIAEKFKEAK